MDLAHPLEVVTPTVDGDVLSVLASARASFTGRQVHQVAGRHSERGVRNALHRLCQQGIVLRERVGSSDRFTLNRSHLAAPHVEAMARLRGSFLERVAATIANWTIQPVYAALFGSSATGQMRVESDIDLLVIRLDAIDPDGETWREQLDRLAEDVTAWTGNDTRILELCEREVSRGLAAAEPILVEIRDHGVNLYGPTTYLQMARRIAKSTRRRG